MELSSLREDGSPDSDLREEGAVPGPWARGGRGLGLDSWVRGGRGWCLDSWVRGAGVGIRGSERGEAGVWILVSRRMRLGSWVLGPGSEGGWAGVRTSESQRGGGPGLGSVAGVLGSGPPGPREEGLGSGLLGPRGEEAQVLGPRGEGLGSWV